jgi:hypothetical protein
LVIELEDEGNSLEPGMPDPDTDGYDWAIEEIREVANKLSATENPSRRRSGPKHSLRTFNLINALIDLIPTDEDDEPTPH